MEPTAIIQIAVIVGLFFIAAFLSLAETALIGMSRIKIIAHIRNEHKAAKNLKVWLKEPNSLLATLSICINAVAISASTIGAFLAMNISSAFDLPPSATATVMAVLITFIIILFGEISPKIFAVHNTERLGLLLVGPVVFIYRMIKPVTAVFVRISNLMVKLAGGRPTESIPIISAKDISTVIDVSMEEGYIGEQEKSMMAGILEFRDLEVKHIMVPRTSVTGVEIGMDAEKIITIALEEGYSRMPVYKDNLDNIVGILYTKDMLAMIKNRGLIIIQDLVRLPYFVPETKNVGELLAEFKRGKFHMAVVVDEFGGTAGVITIEDILEEIVGEIQDEYDMEERGIEKLGDNVYMVKASYEIDKLRDIYKLDIPREDDVNTIGGFVMDLFGYVPKEGEEKKFGNITFEILKADARKVNRVKIKVEKKEEKQEGKEAEK